jgi:hypothetical protein
VLLPGEPPDCKLPSRLLKSCPRCVLTCHRFSRRPQRETGDNVQVSYPPYPPETGAEQHSAEAVVKSRLNGLPAPNPPNRDQQSPSHNSAEPQTNGVSTETNSGQSEAVNHIHDTAAPSAMPRAAASGESDQKYRLNPHALTRTQRLRLSVSPQPRASHLSAPSQQATPGRPTHKSGLALTWCTHTIRS